MESGRLEAFSDGVFAVAITLLALNLAVPGPGHGPLGQQLANHWPAFAAYVDSFLTIGIIWVNHHAVVGNFSDVDRPLLFLNLLLRRAVLVVDPPLAPEGAAVRCRCPGGAGQVRLRRHRVRGRDRDRLPERARVAADRRAAGGLLHLRANPSVTIRSVRIGLIPNDAARLQGRR